MPKETGKITAIFSKTANIMLKSWFTFAVGFSLNLGLDITMYHSDAVL